jgi:hypothetical protein
MNENQLRVVQKGIGDVLTRLEFEFENDPEDKDIFMACTEIGFNELFPAVLYLFLEKDRECISLMLEVEQQHSDDEIIKVMKMANMFNRQPIACHFFVDWKEKTVFLKSEVHLTYGRLNKAELEFSIDALLSNASFYLPIIMEHLESNESTEEWLKSNWTTKSYLHPECGVDR